MTNKKDLSRIREETLDTAARHWSLGDHRYRDLGSLVTSCRQQSVVLSAEDLLYLQSQTDGDAVPTEEVVSFFELLLSTWKATSALIPFDEHGVVAAVLATRLPDKKFEAVPSRESSGGIVKPLGLRNLLLHEAMRDPSLLVGDRSLDAIISAPPIGRRSETRSFLVGQEAFELTDEPSLLSMLALANRLNESGSYAWVVSPRFAVDSGKASVRRNLHRFGLHVSSLLKFRLGAFTRASISFDLAIIDRVQRPNLFVAEVPQDREAQLELIKRMRGRKQGPVATLGRLVAHDDFYGLKSLEAKERYEKLAKASKSLHTVPFATAIVKVRDPKRNGTDIEHCADHPDAVYLPLMTTNGATARREQLSPKLKSYVQLLVNPEVVLPGYLAKMFNTPLGQALRQSTMSGETIPRISLARLTASRLYIPSLKDQRIALEASEKIQALRSELSELESKVWEQSDSLGRVLGEIGKVNHEDLFTDWIETLPFPLASILRSYHAQDRTPKEKYERLLHFFEGLSAFFAAIHLSAFRSSPAHWQGESVRLSEALSKQGLSLDRPSFGAWRVINEKLVSSLRLMLKDQAQQSLVFSMYATADLDPIEVLASSDLLSVMQRVNNFRNRWTGHGGAVTATEAIERLALLTQDIATFREIIGTSFLKYQLIEPDHAEILKGPVFRCRVRKVMGSNPQLEHESVDLTTPAQTGQLYLYNPGNDKALALIPIVQVRDKPQPASYFYNRLDNLGSHLVAYQFSTLSEVSESDETLLELLSEIRPATSSTITE